MGLVPVPVPMSHSKDRGPLARHCLPACGTAVICHLARFAVYIDYGVASVLLTVWARFRAAGRGVPLGTRPFSVSEGSDEFALLPFGCWLAAAFSWRWCVIGLSAATTFVTTLVADATAL